jgi:twitching motility two-component system response regulator PilG
MNESKKQILVVDDEPDAVELMQNILEYEEYAVITASNGLIALEAVKQHNPDLILLDIRMPGEINGLEVCRQLKSDPKTENIPIIIFSAKVLDHHIEEGFEAGADEYVTKPFRSNKLLEIIKNFINSEDKQ